MAVGPNPGAAFGQGKNLPLIAMAHNIPYVATASVANLRDLEAKVRGARPVTTRKEPVRQLSPAHRRVEDALRKRLGTDVKVTAKRRGRGLIAGSYYSDEDLARVLELLSGRSRPGSAPLDMAPANNAFDAVVRVVGAGLMELNPEGGFEPARPVTGREGLDVVEALGRAAEP